MATVKFATQSIQWPQYLAGAVSAFGIFTFGAAFGWASPASAPMRAINDYIQVTPREFGWIAAVLNVGSFLSCLLIGHMMNTLGRRNSMLALVIPILIGWGCIIWTSSLTMIIVGRILVGFGGSFFIASQQYIEEISEEKIRKIVQSYSVIFFKMGMLFSYLMGALINDLFLLNVTCAVLPIIFGGLFYLMPESPHFLVLKMEDSSAIKALKFLRGTEYNYLLEIDEIKQKINLQNQHKLQFSRILKCKEFRLVTGLLFFIQFSGFVAILFYLNDIFEIADISVAPNVASVLVGILYVASTFLSLGVNGKVNKRVWLVINALLMAACLLVLGVYFHQRNSNLHTNLQWIPLTFLSLYVVAFSLGIGSMTWDYFNGFFIYDTKFNVKSLFGVFNWLLAFIVSSIFGVLFNSTSISISMWIFGGFTSLGVLFIGFNNIIEPTPIS